MSHRDNPGKKKDAVSNASAYAEKTFDATRAALLEAERLLNQRAGVTWPGQAMPTSPQISSQTQSQAYPRTHVAAPMTKAPPREIHDIQIARLRETEEFLKNEVVTLTTELAEQRHESEERALELANLQRTLEMHKSEVDFLKATSGRIVEISAKMGVEKDQEIEKLRTFETQHTVELTELNAKCAEQAKALRDKAAAMTELQNEIKILGTELKNVQAELSNSKDQGNRKLSTLLDENWAKDMEVSRLREGEKELKAGFAQMETNFRQTSARLNDVTAELERTEDALMAGREERAKIIDASEATLAQLRAENDRNREALTYARAETDDCKSQLESVTDALTNLQSSYRMRTSELEQATRFHEKQMATLNEDLKRHKTMSSEDARRFQMAASEEAKRQQLSTQLEMDKIRTAREAELTRFNAVRAELESKIETLKETIAKSDADFISSQEIIGQLHEAVTSQTRQRADAEAYARKTEADLVRARESANFAEAKQSWNLHNSRKTEAQLLRQLATQKFQLETSATQAKETFENEIAFRDTEIAARQAALMDVTENFEFERAQFQAEIARARAESVKNQAELAKVEGQFARASEEIAQRLMDVTKANAETVKVATELHETRSYIIGVERALADARSENTQRTRELSAAVDENIDMKRTIEVMTAEGRSTADAFATRETDYRDEIIQLQANCGELETEARNLEDKVDRLESELAEMRVARIRFDQLHGKNEGDRERLDTWNQQLDNWNRQLESREFQLRRYANALTKEKTEALRFSKQIADEMKMARATHPLKDYLRLTEYELSKLEVQAKKTPMLSPDRPKLESALTQMIEQREFLKSVLGSTQRSLEHQANEFLKTIQSGRLAPVPPPPPRSQYVKPARPALQSDAAKAQALVESTSAVSIEPRVDVATPAPLVANSTTEVEPVIATPNADAPTPVAPTEGQFDFRVKWENLDQDLQ